MKTTLLFFCIACLQTANAQDINDIISNIEQNNLRLKVARQANAATMQDLKAENTLGETSVEYSPFFHSGVSGTSSSELIVSQEFDFPTLYAERRKQANRQEAVLDLQYDLLRRDILFEATCLCYDLYTAQQTIALCGNRLAACDSVLAICQKSIEHGEATIIELNRLKIGRMSTQKELMKAKGEKQRIELEICRFSPTFSTPINIEGTPHEDLLSAEATLSADITLAEANLSAAKRDVAVARQEWLPKLTAGYRRNTDIRDAQNGFLVGASIPLFSNSGKVKAARLREAATQTELEDKRNEVHNTEIALRTETENLRRQLAAYDVQLLRQALDTMMRAVNAGEVSIADYYTEEAEVFNLLQEHLDIENSYNKTAAELRFRFSR